MRQNTCILDHMDLCRTDLKVRIRYIAKPVCTETSTAFAVQIVEAPNQ